MNDRRSAIRIDGNKSSSLRFLSEVPRETAKAAVGVASLVGSACEY